MTRAIDQLARDHRNMREILDIIEEEMAVFQTGASPDLDLLRLIMDYTLNYPEVVHHPLENAVFAHLVRRDPGAESAIGDLMGEHRELSALTHRLAAAIANIGRDQEMPRQWLEDAIRQYLDRSRAHMRTEDRIFLPRSLAALTAEDWNAIEASWKAANDPLFGSTVAEEYQKLHQRILRLHI